MADAQRAQKLEDFGIKTPANSFWVFGYGSLMWNPGFPYLERASARLFGYHRAFSMKSVRHRGTPDKPGLVLTLCPGGSCTGRAFLVAPSSASEVCAYLLDREIGTYAYRPAFVSIRQVGKISNALTFLPTPGAQQFVPHISDEARAHLISNAVGGMGSNIEYLQKTIGEMSGLGLDTSRFVALADRVHQLRRHND